MASVFKKLIKSELGQSSYERYFHAYQKLFSDKSYDIRRLDNKEVYDDMYEKLKDIDLETLKGKMDRLSESMFLALRISKTYSFAFFVYVAAMIFILIQSMPVWLIVSSVAALSACFLYKTYEFIVNKYCFIDAHMVIIYKTVLDRLLLKYKLDHDDKE